MRNPRINGNGYMLGTLTLSAYCLYNFFRTDNILHLAVMAAVVAIFSLSIKKHGQR